MQGSSADVKQPATAVQAAGLAGSGYGFCTAPGIGAAAEGGGAAEVQVAIRQTADGRPCRLPVFYKCALQWRS